MSSSLESETQWAAAVTEARVVSIVHCVWLVIGKIMFLYVVSYRYIMAPIPW